PEVQLANARLDAWVTPPAYTGKPPILLADGGAGTLRTAAEGTDLIEVPDKSLLIIRASGAGQLSLEIAATGAEEPQTVEGQAPKQAGDVSEVRAELRNSGTVRVLGSGSELIAWNFRVIPDQAPKIVLTKEPESTIRGGIKLFYKVEEHTSELQSRENLVCRLLLEKKKI